MRQLFLHRRWLMTGVMAFGLMACSLSQCQAAILFYQAIMNGANEAPIPIVTAGTGVATITIDTTVNTMRVQVNFSNLTQAATNAHIHAATTVPFSGTTPPATTTPSFPSFPAATTGTYDQTFDMSLPGSWNASYVSANGGTPLNAFARFQVAMASNRAYFNIHSNFAPGGEIRGFLVAVPEPSSMALLGSVVAGAGWRTWRRRQSATA